MCPCSVPGMRLQGEAVSMCGCLPHLSVTQARVGQLVYILTGSVGMWGKTLDTSWLFGLKIYLSEKRRGLGVASCAIFISWGR